eukprot:6184561-Pleurochrysis_carterae.AAC.1
MYLTVARSVLPSRETSRKRGAAYPAGPHHRLLRRAGGRRRQAPGRLAPDATNRASWASANLSRRLTRPRGASSLRGVQTKAGDKPYG